MPAFILALIIILAPLPLGSNRPLFIGIIGTASALALLSWSRSGKIELPWQRLRLVLFCFSGTWLWSAASLLWSVDFSASLLKLMQLTSYLALAALALQLARDAKQARHFIKAMAFSSLLYALYALGVYALGNDHILLFEKWAYTDSLTGTFVNRNAFAAYTGMGLLACLALLAQAAGRENGELRAALRNATPTFWLAIGGCIVLSIALVLTSSRAGIVSVIIGLASLWGGLFFSRILPRQFLLIIALAGVFLMAGSVAIVGQRLVQRSEQSSFMKDDRPQIWLATLEMIKAQPYTGYGAGTYESMFLQYRTEAIKQNYTKAHSTYLEMAATLGIPASFIFFCGFGFTGIVLLRGIYIRRQNKIYPVLGLALLTQAGVHSLVDFSFQTPANAAILAILLGSCMAQSFSSDHS